MPKYFGQHLLTTPYLVEPSFHESPGEPAGSKRRHPTTAVAHLACNRVKVGMSDRLLFF
jgi:hypothetical protein